EHVRRPGPDSLERGPAVAVFAHHPEVRLARATLPQRAPSGDLVVDDHHFERHADCAAAVAAAFSRTSVRSGMRISATHSWPSFCAVRKEDRSPNWIARRSRTLRSPIPPSRAECSAATVLVTLSVSVPRELAAHTRTTTGP